MALPTLNKFLLLFSLSFGTICTLVWTLIRTSAVIFFLINAIPRIFSKGVNTAFANYILLKPNERLEDNFSNVNIIYGMYVGLLVSEITLLGYTIFNLGSGVYCKISCPIGQYLICRFVVWIIELCILFLLSIMHPILIGWYLILQMIIIQEFYGLVVVYSYFQQLRKNEKSRQLNCPYCKT